MRLHVYGNTAYRSEMTLFRTHGVTATEAAPVDVADDARALFLVEDDDSSPSFHVDSATAFAAYANKGGARLVQMAIV